jgi:hypothetical protein
VPDLLSSGFTDQDEYAGSRPPAYRPRWVSVLLLLALVAGAAVLAVRQGTGRPHAAVPAAAPTPRPTRVILARPPTATPPGATEDLPPDAVYRLDADPGTGPAGTRLVVGGREPGVLDAATGRLTALPAPGLAAGEAVTVRRGRGFTVVLVGVGTRPQPQATLVPDGGGAAVGLGPALDVLPRRDGTVLTLACGFGDNLTGCTLSDRSRTGGTVWSRRGAEPLELIADTPAGVVAGRYYDDGLELRLLDARTGRTLRTFGRAGAMLGVSDRRLAWSPAGCLSACPVLVAELAGGSIRTLPAVAGRSSTGAFSPDSERLAVGFIGLDAHDPDRALQRDGYAAVLDLRTPGWIRAPGLTTGPNSAPVPIWTATGDVLLGTADAGGKGRISLWRAGAARLTVLPGSLAGFDAVPAELALAAG